MAEAFVELGAEGINHITENHWDTIHDNVHRVVKGNRSTTSRKANENDNPSQPREQQQSRRYRNELPSPERERGSSQREDSLERESQASERITRAYRNERDDPIRPVDPALEKRRRRDSARMSYAGGYAQQDRAHSAQPPRNKSQYDDDDSDYDDREGRRYKSNGRGYDDRDDRDYDREVIETERYRGPARPQEARRNDSYASRAYTNDPYGPGAVTAYNRRSQNDLTELSRRSRSRGRNNRYDREDDRDRSYSRSRSRSRDKEEGWRGKLDENFDTSMRGLGVGIAGAVVGGLAGRQFGHKHKERDILIGAVVGGLASNLAENKWNAYREEKKDKLEVREERWEQKWDGGGRDGRSRSQGR